MNRARHWLTGTAACLTMIPSALGARPTDLFEADGRPARQAVVTAGDDLPADRPENAPMLDRLSGILADLDTREIARLRRAAARFEGDPELIDTGELVGVVHLIGRTGTERTELRWVGPDLVARSLDRDDLEPALLDARGIGDLMINWGAPIPTGGEMVNWPGRVLMTDAVTTQRYLGPGRSRGSVGLPPMGRVLTDEHFEVRLPAGYDPTTPSGVLVWISPRPDTWMRNLETLFGPVLDELGLILVGARNNGNDREILDRLQVSFDALESVRRAHFVDDARVYVTGMSGGGRISSILLCSFPEVFAGAVPIVGMNSWHVVRMDDGKYIPQQLPVARRERLAILKERRMRGITGDKDFNAFEMRERTRMFVEDGLQVVLDDYPGMDHEMPTAERFATALRWVDEPARARFAEGADTARMHLEQYKAEHGACPPQTDEAREALLRVVRAGPWSEPAWQAAAWLGYDRPG